jgi:hypothetical protein
MVHPQLLDVSDAASIKEAVSCIVAAHGRIDARRSGTTTP